VPHQSASAAAAAVTRNPIPAVAVVIVPAADLFQADAQGGRRRRAARGERGQQEEHLPGGDGEVDPADRLHRPVLDAEGLAQAADPDRVGW
jgi:hypothetical protein